MTEFDLLDSNSYVLIERKVSMRKILFCCILCAIFFSGCKEDVQPSLIVENFLINLQSGKMDEAMKSISPADARLLKTIDSISRKIKSDYPELSREIAPFEITPFLYLNLKGKTFKTTILQADNNKAVVNALIIPSEKDKKPVSNTFNLIKNKEDGKWVIVLSLNPELEGKLNELVPLTMVSTFYKYLRENKINDAKEFVIDAEKSLIDNVFATPVAVKPVNQLPQAKIETQPQVVVSPSEKLKNGKIECKGVKIKGELATVDINFEETDFKESLKIVNGKWKIDLSKSEIMAKLKPPEPVTDNLNQ